MITVYKAQGLTPLQAIKALQITYPEYKNRTISYAGRLDPMAEGLLLLLVDEENKSRHQYEAYEKTYTFEVLLGASTDSYDLLGLVSNKSVSQSNPNLPEIESYFQTLVGTFSQHYPPYSSKPVQGKPLYTWAREGKLDEIIIPEKEITITSLSILSSRSLSPAELQKNIIEKINRVSGNFRQPAIISSWQSFLDSPSLPDFQVLQCEVSCSSGTYVRSIANALGDHFGCGALAYSIIRTKVGTITLKNAIYLEAIG